MRKSELYEIKVREYERGLADAHKKFRITARDIEEWAEIIADEPPDGKDIPEIEDLLKQMLAEIGVEIIPSQELDTKGR